jgi:hypothetical protein
MLTSPTGRDSEKLWPSLATPSMSGSPSASATTHSLFFGDNKKLIQSAPQKAVKAVDGYDDNDDDEDEIECKTPAYKNNLSDALANALKSKASLGDAKSSSTAAATASGKNKKKGKKTLLFSSGMNFN